MHNQWAARIAALRLRIFLIIVIAFLLPASRTEATVIKDLRIGSTQKYVRMVLESDQPLSPPPSFSIDDNALEVSLTGVDKKLAVGPFEDFSSDIISLEISRTSDVTRLEAVFSFAPADVKTFSLTKPHRFIIDAYRPLAATTGDPPLGKAGQVTASANRSHDSALTKTAQSLTEASVRAYRSVLSDNGVMDGTHPNRFHQRLLATLIGVTSIILILLFFLVFIGSRRKKSSKQSWINYLPLTQDPIIEDLDTQIGEHLSTLTATDSAD